MEEHSPRRPEELLYRMGHSTRAMSAFFSLDEAQRQQILEQTAHADTPAQAEQQLDRAMTLLEGLGDEQDRPIR